MKTCPHCGIGRKKDEPDVCAKCYEKLDDRLFAKLANTREGRRRWGMKACEEYIRKGLKQCN